MKEERLAVRQLLDRVAADTEDRMALAQLFDKSEQCGRGTIPTATSFLNPRQQTLAEEIRFRLPINPVFYGGYAEAERRIALFLPEWAEGDMQYAPITALRLRWSEKSGVSLSHRDFLGAMMGAGIRRDTVGDILVRETECDIIVMETVAPYITETLTEVGRASVSIAGIELCDIILPERKVKILRDTVASVRFDAIASIGFSLSREKARDLIATGHAVLNNLICDKPDKPVNGGDVISARGFGKFRVLTVGNTSKKGRIWVEVERYE